MKMDKIMRRLHEDYETIKGLGLEVVGVFLQGSQNYGLAHEGSDIDTKAIIVPSFYDFALNRKPVSTTHILETNEHIDLKDIRLMFDCFRKQNINFVEILFSKYILLNEKYAHCFKPLLERAEEVARYNQYAAINCMVGMSYEKLKALEHPYPSLLDKIEKFGYDPKQLHHILRINDFIKRYVAGERYADCLIPKQKDYLIEVKKGLHTLEEARTLAKATCEETKSIKDEYMSKNNVVINQDVEFLLNSVLTDVLKESFREIYFKEEV